MLSALVGESARRHMQRVEAATSSTASIPPNIKKHLAAEVERLQKAYPAINLSFPGSCRESAKVCLSTGKTRSLSLKLGALSCECGGPGVTGQPCADMLLAADQAGVP